MQDIEELTFVFVDALDLAVEYGIRVDRLPGASSNQAANRSLAARLARRNPSRKAGSSAIGTSFRSRVSR